MTAPVLLLVFNRPELTRRLVETVRAASPARLYVAADGARSGVPGEREAAAAVRAAVTGAAWRCPVETLFRETNLGLRRAVGEGLTWFFEREEAGIVLEDDCLPSPSFFRYASELLSRYRDEPRVMAIGGVNFQPGPMRSPHSYYFSRYNHVWGWAGWRRAWTHYDEGMSAWPRVRETDRLERVLGSRRAARYFTAEFDAAYERRLDTWDYGWTLAVWLAGGLTALPRRNLVSNLGFGDQATHTRASSPLAAIPAGELEFPLVHPAAIAGDDAADRRTFERCFGGPGLARRALRRLGRLVSS